MDTPRCGSGSGSDTWTRAIGGKRAPSADRATQPNDPRLSPDGQRVAVSHVCGRALDLDLSNGRRNPVRLDSESTDQHGPSWSPDGNWIAYRRLLKGHGKSSRHQLGGGPVVRLDDAAAGGGATDWSSTRAVDRALSTRRHAPGLA